MDDFFEPFLKELAKALDFPVLKPDLQGACLIHFYDKNASLLFELDDHLVPHTVIMSCDVMPIKSGNLPEFFELCLKENYSGEETFSCSPDDLTFTLHRRLQPEIPSFQLKKVIHAFLERVPEAREQASIALKKSPSPGRFLLPPPTFEIPPYRG